MADTQTMMKDLISTVEEKVNKPLAQSTGALTQEFFADPSATRNRIVTENAGNPLDPLKIDALVGQRRGLIGGQIAGNTALAGANADILNNYFNLINQQAERASTTAYRNSQARKKNYSLEATPQGYRAYDPEEGKFLPGILGDIPEEYSDDDIQAFVDAYANGQIEITGIPSSIRSRVLAEFNARPQEEEGAGTARFFPDALSDLLGGWAPFGRR